MHTNNFRRVVITGMGTVNPLGLDVETSWENVTTGVSGIGPITLFDSSSLRVHIAAEVKNFEPAHYMEVKEARRRDRVTQFAVAATREAMAQSNLQIDRELAEDVGVIIGSGVGGITSFDEAVQTMVKDGPRRISPLAIPLIIADGPSGTIAIEYKTLGINYAPVSACASGSDAIGMAYNAIRRGEMRAAISGGTEAAIVQVGIAAFDRTGACSTNNENPTRASRPFDKNREGLVFGEGCAIMVLEDLELALARGATPLAEVIGYGATSDAFHITAPLEDGSGAARAIRKALDDARLTVNDIDWISAHGTATQLNDQMETRAIKTVFGEQAYNVPISGTKSMTGHMMGATGALEAIWCVKAIHTAVIPPTMNYETPDPDCDLNYTPNAARQLNVDVALTSAFGFGGHNSVLIIKRFEA